MGVHMVGPDAPEIMQGVAIAMKAGATKAHFDSTVRLGASDCRGWVTEATCRRAGCRHVCMQWSSITVWDGRFLRTIS